MAKLANKRLIVHLDRFSGSGPVTKEEIISAIESRLPGATAEKKFRLRTVVRKKDNELIKINIRFDENVDNVVIAQIRNDILTLAGVLEGGISDMLPSLVEEASDDFESYDVGNDIIANSAGKWVLNKDHDLDLVNPPTFTCSTELVWEGSKSGKLELKKESTNLSASVKADYITSPETESIRFEGTLALLKDPFTGKAEIKLNKIGRLALYGSRFFSVVGPNGSLNGKFVLYSKDSVTGLEKADILGTARFDVLYKWFVTAEVDGLTFETFIASQDGEDCYYKQYAHQTEGVVEADLGSGILDVSVIAERAPVVAGGGGDTDAYAVGEVDTDFDLGEATEAGFGTCIKLNSADVMDDPIGKGRIELGPVDEYWNPNLTAWTVEFKVKELADGLQYSPYATLLSLGYVGEAGKLLMNLWPGDKFVAKFMKADRSQITQSIIGFDISSWSHILWQWTGTNLELYMNGVLKHKAPLTEAPVTPINRNALVLGDAIRHSTPMASQFLFRGYMDEFRFSNIARFTGAVNVNESAVEGVPVAPHVSDANTLRLLHMDEPYEGVGVFNARMVDSGPMGLATPDDIEVVTDEISLIAEG